MISIETELLVCPSTKRYTKQTISLFALSESNWMKFYWIDSPASCTRLSQKFFCEGLLISWKTMSCDAFEDK